MNDPALDALLVKGQGQELGTQERRQTYLDAQKKVMDILPFVGVMSQVRVEAMSAKVHDFKPGPDGLTGLPNRDLHISGSASRERLRKHDARRVSRQNGSGNQQQGQ